MQKILFLRVLRVGFLVRFQQITWRVEWGVVVAGVVNGRGDLQDKRCCGFTWCVIVVKPMQNVGTM